jgi:hypothetical protein
MIRVDRISVSSVMIKIMRIIVTLATLHRRHKIGPKEHLKSYHAQCTDLRRLFARSIAACAGRLSSAAREMTASCKAVWHLMSRDASCRQSASKK